MIDCCGQDCPDRSPTCHATCERYAKQRAKHEAELAELAKKKEAKFQAYRTLLDGKNRAVAQRPGHKKVYQKPTHQSRLAKSIFCDIMKLSFFNVS